MTISSDRSNHANASQFRTIHLSWFCISVSVFTISLALRWYFVAHAHILQPVNSPNVRGDGVDYFHYAWNILHHGTFSSAPPDNTDPIPDSFRDPGYPSLMSAWMAGTDSYEAWYEGMLLTQALLGAFTTVFATMTARRILSPAWLLVAGIIMACWPHNITISAYLLSETLLGFLLSSGLFLLSMAAPKQRTSWGCIAGLTFSLAALTNAVLIPLAPIIAITGYLAARRQWRFWLLFTLSSLLPIGAWALRNTTLPPSAAVSSTRAMTNLVQGSWPEYHSSYQAAVLGDPEGLHISTEIDDEITHINQDRSEGLAIMLRRMAKSPWKYVEWYASKPILLWGWDIRMGQGDVYVYPTRNSPLKTERILRLLTAIMHALNPILFVAWLAGIVILLRQWRNYAPEGLPLVLSCMLATGVYCALQAEPRYSIAFRPEQILIAVFTMATATSYLRALRARTVSMAR